MPQEVETLIVGAGPAGLAMAACLEERDLPYLVVEAGADVGTSWRNHYERLHLHTVKQHSALPGLGFGDEVPRYPSRAEVVAYLERYAKHFGIEPRFLTPVTKLRPEGKRWIAETGEVALDCTRVVLATGFNRRPVLPQFEGQMEFHGRIVHSADYRNGAPFAGKRVLVVGAGNTGGELALDLLEHDCEVAMCIRSPLHVVPRDFLGLPTQVTSLKIAALPLSVRDRIARTVSRLGFGSLRSYGIKPPQIGPISQIVEHKKIPLIDIGTIAKIKAGQIVVYPAIAKLSGDEVVFEDARRASFDAIVLATGYRSGLGTLVEGGTDLLDDSGYPVPGAGETRLPGLFTIGFNNPPTGWLRQIGLDAPMVADAIAKRARA